MSWRFGQGGPLALAGQRALIGALFLAPVFIVGLRKGTVRSILTSRAALATVIFSGSTMPFTATMFRALTGPQVAMISAITPAVILLVSSVIHRRAIRTVGVLVLTAVVFAAAAALSGGFGSFATAGLVSAPILLLLNLGSMLTLEEARNEGHGSSLLVACSMVFATIGCYGAALVVPGGAGHLATSGLLAATVVGVLGTLARVLRAKAIVAVGAAVAESSTHLTALLTAIGGVIVFHDEVGWLSGLLGLAAAGFALASIIKAGRQKDPSPSESAPAKATT